MLVGEEAVRGSSLTGTPIKPTNSKVESGRVIKPFNSDQNSPIKSSERMPSTNRPENTTENINLLYNLLKSGNDKIE